MQCPSVEGFAFHKAFVRKALSKQGHLPQSRLRIPGPKISDLKCSRIHKALSPDKMLRAEEVCILGNFGLCINYLKILYNHLPLLCVRHI